MIVTESSKKFEFESGRVVKTKRVGGGEASTLDGSHCIIYLYYSNAPVYTYIYLFIL